MLAISGCVGSGIDTAAIDEPDRSLVTASIPAPRPAKTDPAAIGDAVVTADLHGTDDDGVPWANPATGSAGVISYVEEVHADNRTCRRFETSRHSYDGIALFVGETCRGPGQDWRVMSFGPKVPVQPAHGISEG